jgi:hypothetical protein
VNGSQTNNSIVQSGAAYVFVRSGTTWRQQAYLKSAYPVVGGEFGYSLAFSGETVAIGSVGAGAVDVFARSGTNWSHQRS